MMARPRQYKDAKSFANSVETYMKACGFCCEDCIIVGKGALFLLGYDVKPQVADIFIRRAVFNELVIAGRLVEYKRQKGRYKNRRYGIDTDQCYQEYHNGWDFQILKAESKITHGVRHLTMLGVLSTQPELILEG